jgi:hypothetical protein
MLIRTAPARHFDQHHHVGDDGQPFPPRASPAEVGSNSIMEFEPAMGLMRPKTGRCAAQNREELTNILTNRYAPFY